MTEDNAAKRGRMSWLCTECGGWKIGYYAVRCINCVRAEQERKAKIRHTCPECGGHRVKGAKLCRDCASKAQSARLTARWTAATAEERRHHARGLIKRNRENPTQRKYTVDHGYFDQIDTPEKAYWLGFIAGDGCIRGGALVVGLAERDSGHLERFAEALRSNAPIRHNNHVARGKSHPAAVLRVTSWRLVESLAGKGIQPGKTFSLEPWDGPASLMPHYWRGLVDADGSIGIPPNWEVSLVGTRAVVSGFSEWVRGIEPGITAQPRPHKSIWGFALGGRVFSRSVVGALYEDAPVALQRKAERAAALIATGPRRPRSEFAVVSVGPDGQAHGDSSYGRGCRCQLCRNGHAGAAADYKARQRAALPPRTCRDCGTDISHRYCNARYCETCSEKRKRGRPPVAALGVPAHGLLPRKRSYVGLRSGARRPQGRRQGHPCRMGGRGVPLPRSRQYLRGQPAAAARHLRRGDRHPVPAAH